MKPGKVMVHELPCRFLVVQVVDGARLLVARCRQAEHAERLARESLNLPGTPLAEVWYLHGNGKLRALEHVYAAASGTVWKSAVFVAPESMRSRWLLLPTKGV